MIAEHEFVTTFEEDEALAAATHILQRMGFTVRVRGSRLNAKRGVAKPQQAKRERHLPQSVEMSFDRGRCHLAASIQFASKPKPLYRDLITTMLTTIERVLVHGMTDEEALEAWHHIDARANVRAAQHSSAGRVVLWILVGFLCLLLMGCLIGIFVSAMNP